MKKTLCKYLTTFLLLFLAGSTMYATAQKTYTKEGLEKFYVPAHDIVVVNNGIFVNFEGETLIVSSVHLDSSGAYIAGLGSCNYCGLPNDDMGKCMNPRCKNYRKG